MQDELSRVREALAGAFAGDSGVLLAVLFGSAARGSLSRESDVDVGIVPADPGVSLAWELQLQGRLMTACGRPVDLVRPDRASTLVRWEVARVALPLFTASSSVFTSFIAQAALEHADIAPLMERTAEVYRTRLAPGVPR